MGSVCCSSNLIVRTCSLASVINDLMRFWGALACMIFDFFSFSKFLISSAEFQLFFSWSVKEMSYHRSCKYLSERFKFYVKIAITNITIIMSGDWFTIWILSFQPHTGLLFNPWNRYFRTRLFARLDTADKDITCCFILDFLSYFTLWPLLFSTFSQENQFQSNKFYQ